MMANRITRADDIIWRKIENEIAVLRNDGRTVHILNESAAHIWEMCNGDNGPDEIAASLCIHFDVSAEEARADVYDTIGELEELNIVIWDREGTE
jgi:hypothetical protein